MDKYLFVVAGDLFLFRKVVPDASSSFFSEIKWDRPDRLAGIYERDEAIVVGIATLLDRLADSDLPLAELRRELISLQRAVGERRNVILNLGRE